MDHIDDDETFLFTMPPPPGAALVEVSKTKNSRRKPDKKKEDRCVGDNRGCKDILSVLTKIRLCGFNSKFRKILIWTATGTAAMTMMTIYSLQHTHNHKNCVCDVSMSMPMLPNRSTSEREHHKDIKMYIPAEHGLHVI